MIPIQEMQSAIRSVFADPIESIEICNHGEDFFVLEINRTWMFRFPRSPLAGQALAVEKQFLPRLATLSPLPVPEPRYVGLDFIGYRKIQGACLTHELFETLGPSTRGILAKQIGEFLSTVHAFPLAEAVKMGVTESWGGWRRRAFDRFEQQVTPLLSVPARQNALAFFEDYFAMQYPRVIIHGDFYPPDHVFFDESKQMLSGVIDFGDLTIEDAATDFKSLYVDFGQDFYRQVIDHYSGPVDAQMVERIHMRHRAHPLFDAPYALEYHQPERFHRQLSAIETTFGGRVP
jgi:aminoglycoside 2''-phosphotransferase